MRTETQNSLFQNIRNLVMQPNYPCVSAVSSFLKNDYMIENYPEFGSGKAAERLYADLLHFKNEQRLTQAPFYSFWAVYEDSEVTSEDEFEEKLWLELSAVHSYEVKKCAEEDTELNWDPKFSSNPHDKNFCFSVGGDAYFVVGMHPHSSRKARHFPYPILIFNLYTQFEDLFQKNTFEPLAKINRLREMKFQGSINPMVEKHAQEWESIQFSGKKNDDQWKCPFQRLIHKVIG